MKRILIFCLFAYVLASCGGGKKAILNAEKQKQEATIAKAEKEKALEEEKKKLKALEEQKKKETMEALEEKKKMAEEKAMKEKEAMEGKKDKMEKEKLVEVFNHSSWNDLLTANVTKEGNVNYEGFRKRKTELRAYIASLGENTPKDSWTQEDQLAYWMNAYNAMTVDLILRNLPLESIKDIDKPWDQRLWKLDGKWYNLNQIEHQILRKMDDPRIHFGINCASFSCPPLLNEAFTSSSVDAQLEQLAKQFVNDTKRNTITASKIKVSKIFNWFAKDFKQDGNLIDFLNKYSEIPINDNAKKSYRDYNWSLNK